MTATTPTPEIALARSLAAPIPCSPRNGGANQALVSYEVHRLAHDEFVTVNFLTEVFGGRLGERKEIARSHVYASVDAAANRGHEWLYPGSRY